MRAFLLCILFLVPSCALVDSAREMVKTGTELVDTGRTIVDQGEKLIGQAKEEFAKAKAAADTNKDGKTSFEEWWIYLLGLLGIGGAGVIRNGKSNERKAKTEAKVDAQDERLKKIEELANAPRRELAALSNSGILNS